MILRSMKEELDETSRNALIQYRLQRAKETLAEVPFHQENGFYSTAINRMYYASFYAAQALLLSEKHEVATHQGVKQQLGLHFVVTGKLSRERGRFFSQIFEARHSNDYDDFIETTEEEVAEFYPKAQDFIAGVEELLGQNSTYVNGGL